MNKINNLYSSFSSCFQYIKLMTIIFTCLLITACNDNRGICNAAHSPIRNEDGYLTAAEDGNTELVKNYMISANTDWRVVDEQGQTALILASANGHVNIVKLFTINKKKCFSTNINHKDNNNKTALIVARENGHTNVVDLLIRAGARDDTE